MSNELKPKPAPGQTLVYQIRLKGHLGREWADWFDGLSITLEDNSETLLTGPVADQAALYGVLKKVRNLGAPLVSVVPVESGQADSSDCAQEIEASVFGGREMNSNRKTTPQDTKKIFLKCGACSHTFFYILNREFGCPKETEERAADPLAGGLMCGQQCGMLWGSALAVGAEAFHRQPDRRLATARAITTTQHLMESFSKRANSVNCREIVGFDFTNKFALVKFVLNTLLHGGIKNSVCFNLAEKWAPEGIQSAAQGLSCEQTALPQLPISCASEVAQKMGASDEEMVMVAGFAGGMGLSGNACGALGAAIWMNTLAWHRKHPGQTPPSYNKENTTRILRAFNVATGSEILCHKIAGRGFKTINDHTEFIKNGGCDQLINILGRS